MSYYGGQRVVVVDPNSPFAQGALFVFSCGILYLLGYFFWMFREFNFEVRHSPMPPDGTLRIP